MQGHLVMTERQTPAIVLTVREYGEADLMVNFLSPEYGALTGIAKHARKSRRRFAHCLEPLSRVMFFLSPRAGRDLEFLQKGELVQSFPALRRDYGHVVQHEVPHAVQTAAALHSRMVVNAS